MRKMTIGTIVILLIAGTTSAANPTLWDKLIDVALQHIKTNGPDAETGQFIGMVHRPGSTVDDLVRSEASKAVLLGLVFEYCLRPMGDRQLERRRRAVREDDARLRGLSKSVRRRCLGVREMRDQVAR